jgi:hypothetical protein
MSYTATPIPTSTKQEHLSVAKKISPEAPEAPIVVIDDGTDVNTGISWINNYFLYGEIMPDDSNFVNECILVINWPAPNNTAVIPAIRALRPKAILVFYSVFGDDLSSWLGKFNSDPHKFGGYEQISNLCTISPLIIKGEAYTSVPEILTLLVRDDCVDNLSRQDVSRLARVNITTCRY